MPSVPKPSSRKSSKEKPHRIRRAHKVVNRKMDHPVRSGHVLALQHLPKKGKLSKVLEVAREHGGMTKAEFLASCVQLELSASGTKHAAYLANKLQLLKGQ